MLSPRRHVWLLMIEDAGCSHLPVFQHAQPRPWHCPSMQSSAMVQCCAFLLPSWRSLPAQHSLPGGV